MPFFMPKKFIIPYYNKIKGFLVINYDISIILTSLILWVVSSFVLSGLFTALGIAVTLFFLGYLFTLLLFPRDQDMNIFLRLFISVVLSLAAMPILGMSMKYLGYRIDTASSVSIYFIMIAVLTSAAIIVRSKIHDPFHPPQGIVTKTMILMTGGEKGHVLIYRVMAIVLALSMVGAVLFIGFYQSPASSYTEFYILSEGGDTQNYPHNLTLGQTSNVTLGIVNHEGETMDYTISYWLVKGNVTEGRYVPLDQYFLGQGSVSLDAISVQVTGDWQAQYETNISFSLNMTGEFRVWFLLTNQDDDVNFHELVGGIDYINVYGDLLQKALDNNLESLFLTVNVQ